MKSSNIMSWTEGVDITEKDYLLIPICENMHWLLAIVCFPREVTSYVPGSVDLESYRPCILLFDSMSTYSRAPKITLAIRK
jgi:Ulp1 family protease